MIMGNILPDAIVRALSVGLYGMFIAIFVPPAKHSRVILRLVAICMVASYACSALPGIRDLSSGLRTILLTVLISAAAASLAPLRLEKEDDDA